VRDGVTQYVHTDALGSPVAHTKPDGTPLNWSRFEPYGFVAQGTKPSAATSVIGFTGHQQDSATDLVYMQQRYYDPIAGRFLSVDPVVTDANTGKGFGLYTYVDNNPYAKTDPTGMAPAENPYCLSGGGCSGAGVSINQSSGKASAQTYDTSTPSGILAQSRADIGAGAWNAVRAVSAGYAAVSLTIIGGLGEVGAVAVGTATAEKVAAGVLTEAGGLRLSTTAANSVANRAYVTPLAVREAIIGGERIADPQGVVGRFMYTVGAAYNKSVGKFEVLVNEVENIIEHAVFKSAKP